MYEIKQEKKKVEETLGKVGGLFVRDGEKGRVNRRQGCKNNTKGGEGVKREGATWTAPVLTKVDMGRSKVA